MSPMRCLQTQRPPSLVDYRGDRLSMVKSKGGITFDLMIDCLHGTRPRGRPITTWLKDLINQGSINYTEAITIPRDRNKWIVKRHMSEWIVKLKYFGHVTRHNGLEKTIMQEMVAGIRSRGKPRQKWEKYITYMFSTMATASRVAEWICSEKKSF